MRGIEHLWGVLIGVSLLAGCSGPIATETAFRAEAEGADSYADVLVEQAPLAGSLFASDTNLLSNEAVKSVLSAPVRLPDEAKVALLNLTPGGEIGGGQAEQRGRPDLTSKTLPEYRCRCGLDNAGRSRVGAPGRMDPLRVARPDRTRSRYRRKRNRSRPQRGDAGGLEGRDILYLPLTELGFILPRTLIQ